MNDKQWNRKLTLEFFEKKALRFLLPSTIYRQLLTSISTQKRRKEVGVFLFIFFSGGLGGGGEELEETWMKDEVLEYGKTEKWEEEKKRVWSLLFPVFHLFWYGPWVVMFGRYFIFYSMPCPGISVLIMLKFPI